MFGGIKMEMNEIRAKAKTVGIKAPELIRSIQRAEGNFENNLVEERRRFPRIHSPPIVLYRCADELPPLGVKRFDISKGGIRLLLPKDPEDKAIQLMIYLPDHHPISTIGKAIWTKARETEEGKFFETGIEFTQLEQPDKAAIETFINEKYLIAHEGGKALDR